MINASLSDAVKFLFLGLIMLDSSSKRVILSEKLSKKLIQDVIDNSKIDLEN